MPTLEAYQEAHKRKLLHGKQLLALEELMRREQVAPYRHRQFDPEGEGYDYYSAIKAGLSPNESGHWQSRDPKTGLLLKGRKHKTWDLLEKGEREAGYLIFKGDDGRYYSQPKAGK